MNFVRGKLIANIFQELTNCHGEYKKVFSFIIKKTVPNVKNTTTCVLSVT